MGNLRYLMNRSELLDDGEGATSRWCTKICARKDSGEVFWKMKCKCVICTGFKVVSNKSICKSEGCGCFFGEDASFLKDPF